MKITCDVIQDLMPSYIDGILSEDRSGDADKRPEKGEQKDGKGDHSTGQHANQGGGCRNQGRHHDEAAAAFLRGV